MTEIEESPLVKLFGDEVLLEVIDTLMDHPTYNYTKKELAEVVGVSRQTLHTRWEKLENLDVVKVERKVGASSLYKLNRDSVVVEGLYELEEKLKERGENQQ